MAPYAICEPAVETSTGVDPGETASIPVRSRTRFVRRNPQPIRILPGQGDPAEESGEPQVELDFGPPREEWVVGRCDPPAGTPRSKRGWPTGLLALTKDVDPDYYRSILQAVRLFADWEERPTLEATKLCRDVLASLEDEPIEDGCFHPAEEIIRIAIETPETVAWSSIESIYYENTHRPSICAGILRCVGRQPHELVGECGTGLARRGLIHGDPEVREAAVRAFESWGGTEAISVLKAHTEPVDWLADYVTRVIADLSS